MQGLAQNMIKKTNEKENILTDITLE